MDMMKQYMVKTNQGMPAVAMTRRETLRMVEKIMSAGDDWSEIVITQFWS